ncbi:uridine kinase [Streptomyces sp. NPDC059740]|uniref:uridine kinase family protein n=1 Tax=Streptomyces sp. NPDC059740 TaxID=3346926 RepID=UPI0036563DA7
MEHSRGHDWAGNEQPLSIAALAGRLGGGAPSLGPVRLVGVDGHAGSGKTTFCAALSGLLGGAPVLHLDDIASHEALFAWTDRLSAQVLSPLAAGRPARYEVYDWVQGRYDGSRVLPAAPVVLVEGVGAGRRALRPHLSALVWMDTGREPAWARGRLRDGPGLSEFWSGWMAAESRHFSMDPARPYADFLVREGREGYEVLPGPAQHH